MNLKKLEELLHPCVALAFGAGLLVAFAPPPARADAASDWVAYRNANGLPVDPKPSLPGESPTRGGPVPDTLIEPMPDAVAGSRNGNGNGDGAKACEFLTELAKSDGDVRGEDVSCK